MSLESAGASRGCFPPATSMAASGLGFGVHVRPATAPSMVLGRAGGGSAAGRVTAYRHPHTRPRRRPRLLKPEPTCQWT